MKEIKKIVQKLSREQESAAPAAHAPALEPVQKHKVNPGIPGWLNKSLNTSKMGLENSICELPKDNETQVESNFGKKFFYSPRPTTLSNADGLL